MAAVGIWVISLAMGVGAVWIYAATPGQPATGEVIHVDRDLSLVPGRVNVVMVLHPECPCSRASLSELERLLARHFDQIAATVLFIGFDTVSSPAESDLWKAASRIPGVRVQLDAAGDLARRLGAMTSGQVFAYDQRGILRFSGGITASRGHEGWNVGIDAIDAIAQSQTPAITSTDVFGCELW